MTEARKPGLRGEHEGNRNTVARGVPDCFGVPVVTYARMLLLFAYEAAGAQKHPAFPAPSFVEGRGFCIARALSTPRECMIASGRKRHCERSEAIQNLGMLSAVWIASSLPLLAMTAHTVITGHSRSKNGVASARLCPVIHVFFLLAEAKAWMARSSSPRRRAEPVIGPRFARTRRRFCPAMTKRDWVARSSRATTSK
jgi:hypothetical protein